MRPSRPFCGPKPVPCMRIEARAPYEEEVRERLPAGREVTAEVYERALAAQPAARAAFDGVLQEVEVIMAPTCGVAAPPHFSGHQSLLVPFGKDTRRLPIGIQLIGSYHAEAVFYQLGGFLAR